MPIILTTWEADIKRIRIQGHLRQNVQETLKEMFVRLPSTENSWAWWYVPIISETAGNLN
jgi:hypothetical protein